MYINICICVFGWVGLSRWSLDAVRGAEHWTAAMQSVWLHAGVIFWPSGCPSHDHHQLNDLWLQPSHPVLRCWLHHLCAERRRQAQNLSGFWGGPAGGRPAVDHPGQLVGSYYCERLPQPLGSGFPEERDGSVHLYGLGRWSADDPGWRSALLLQQAQIWQLRRNRQVLQQ